MPVLLGPFCQLNMQAMGMATSCSSIAKNIAVHLGTKIRPIRIAILYYLDKK